MQELRLVAVSEDGSYAVLVAPGRSGRFALPIDERLRTVAKGQFSRLAQYDIEVESPLRPKEIQDRIRAGETAEEIADAAGLPVDRIRRFEGPVLAEREYRAREAQRATVRGLGEPGPGPRLGEVVEQRLSDQGATAEDAEWDSRKRPDGNWQVQLAYTVGGRMQLAEWVYDPRSKHVTPEDDHAIRLCLPESDWPSPRGQATATVTPIGSRSASAHQSDQRQEPDRAAGRGLAAARQAGGQLASPPRDVLRPAAQAPRQLAEPPRPAAELARLAAESARPVIDQPRQLAEPPRPAAELIQVAAEPDRPAAELGRVPAESALQAAELARPEAEAPVPAAPATAASQTAGPASQGDEADHQPRPAKRTSGARSRRASVPSWDEIMFGNSRQPE